LGRAAVYCDPYSGKAAFCSARVWVRAAEAADHETSHIAHGRQADGGLLTDPRGLRFELIEKKTFASGEASGEGSARRRRAKARRHARAASEGSAVGIGKTLRA
jgi:hypothetical protein